MCCLVFFGFGWSTAGRGILNLKSMLIEIARINKEEVTAVSSLDVAEFRKEHKNVLKDIRELGCSEDFFGINFIAKIPL